MECFFFDCAAYRFHGKDDIDIVYDPSDRELPWDLLGFAELRRDSDKKPHDISKDEGIWLNAAWKTYAYMKKLAADVTGKACIFIDFEGGVCEVQLRNLRFLDFAEPREWKSFIRALGAASAVELMDDGENGFWLEARFYAAQP